MPEAAVTEFVERVLQAARLGGASELDVATLQQMLEQRHEFGTVQLARRVRKLELQLSTMSKGERREAIMARMGISRRHYYDLRKLASAAPECTAIR